jgi:hypothetical protein
MTVGARSKGVSGFDRSNAGVVGSNPTRDMDICICVYSVSGALHVFVSRGLILHPKNPIGCI